MGTGTHDVAVQVDRTSFPDGRSRNLRRWWSIITTLLVLAVFSEAVFAGAMLSGIEWARQAHSANAAVLIASTLTGGLVAVATLRHIANGLKLALTLLSLAAVMVVQAALGALSAKGANLLWVHVPLGVALVGLAALAVTKARRLDGEK